MLRLAKEAFNEFDKNKSGTIDQKVNNYFHFNLEAVMQVKYFIQIMNRYSDMILLFAFGDLKKKMSPP